jgi:hypothetical protein
MNGRIELHIDELVLHGVPQNDAGQIGLAVERELTRLLSLHGLPPSLSVEREVEVVDGGRFAVTLHSRPPAIGNQVAGAVFKGMGRAKDPVRSGNAEGGAVGGPTMPGVREASSAAPAMPGSGAGGPAIK